jgi:hypothetical protein
MLGRGPGRWVTANGFILFFATGVYFDSISSQWAMGHLRFMVVLGFFFSGGSQRRGGRVWTFRKDPRAIVVIFSFLRGLRGVWQRQLHLYPVCTSLYLYAPMYVFLK